MEILLLITKNNNIQDHYDTYNKQYNINIPFKERLVKPSLFSGWISGFSYA
jgi:hypothetical protein